jgi:hypothetical protein
MQQLKQSWKPISLTMGTAVAMYHHANLSANSTNWPFFITPVHMESKSHSRSEKVGAFQLVFNAQVYRIASLIHRTSGLDGRLQATHL